MNKNAENNIIDYVNWKSFMISVFVIGSLWALINTFSDGLFNLVHDNKIPWTHIFLFNYNSFIIWILITPLLFYFSIKVLSKNHKWYTIVLKHFIFASIIAPTQALLFLSFDFFVQNNLSLWTKNIPYPNYIMDFLYLYSLEALLKYGIITGLLLGYILYIKNIVSSKQKADLEKNLAQSRIRNLKHQLQPHFLFNSMQTISNLMHINVNVADEAIANLSDILRFSINQLNNDLISLNEEIEIIKKYLSFQKLRFKDQVDYSLLISKHLESEKIPALLLQPIVENSIKHGFETSGESIKIKIEIVEEKNEIVIIVTDNGPGFMEGFENKPDATGLINLKHRLTYFYKEDFEFNMTNRKKGAKTEIRLPK
nr:histidine kinase [uncultured Psychroserpens sp.]